MFTSTQPMTNSLPSATTTSTNGRSAAHPHEQLFFVTCRFVFFLISFNAINEIWCLPVCRYWGLGYTKCELPQARPEIAPVLPSLIFKASPFSPLLLWWLLQWSQACSLGGPSYPSIPCAREQPHALVLGTGRQGRKRQS